MQQGVIGCVLGLCRVCCYPGEPCKQGCIHSPLGNLYSSSSSSSSSSASCGPCSSLVTCLPLAGRHIPDTSEAMWVQTGQDQRMHSRSVQAYSPAQHAAQHAGVNSCALQEHGVLTVILRKLLMRSTSIGSGASLLRGHAAGLLDLQRPACIARFIGSRWSTYMGSVFTLAIDCAVRHCWRCLRQVKASMVDGRSTLCRINKTCK
jgi:hypothetical protein